MNKKIRDKLIIDLLESLDKVQDVTIRSILEQFIKELKKEETNQSSHINKRYIKSTI